MAVTLSPGCRDFWKLPLLISLCTAGLYKRVSPRTGSCIRIVLFFSCTPCAFILFSSENKEKIHYKWWPSSTDYTSSKNKTKHNLLPLIPFTRWQMTFLKRLHLEGKERRIKRKLWTLCCKHHVWTLSFSWIFDENFREINTITTWDLPTENLLK